MPDDALNPRPHRVRLPERMGALPPLPREDPEGNESAIMREMADQPTDPHGVTRPPCPSPDDLAQLLARQPTEGLPPMSDNLGVPRGHVCRDHSDVMEGHGEIKAELRGICSWLAKLDAKLDARLDGIAKVVGEHSVEIGRLQTKAAIYAAIVAAIVAPIVAAATVGLLKLAGG